MCGITGFIGKSFNEGHDPAHVLNAMMNTLHHRGPDERNFYIEKEHDLNMGHTRLSINGLNSGRQPIVDNEAKVILSVNGEFYDFKQHRARLACDGRSFTTLSDSEIAIGLYKKYGLDFVHHLRGEFALVLYDLELKQLIMVRDRFGIKPLYYHESEQGLVYGSEVKAILQHPKVPAKLCPKAMLHQMMQVMVPGSTSFEGVHSLKPGQMLILKKNGTHYSKQISTYWDLNYPDKGHDSSTDPQVYVDGVRERLIDAVRVRLEADVPVGCYLSGGIDSCSMLGLATPMQQSPVKAYTISFDHESYDEKAIASEMAIKSNAKQEILNLKHNDLYGENFPSVVWHTERTFYNTLSVAKWHMSRCVRDSGFKVVITGEGSDELFGGYPFFKRDYLLHDKESRSKEPGFENVFQGAILAEVEVTHPAFNDLCGFTPSWIQPWMLTLKQIYPLLSDSTKDLLQDYDPIEAIASSLNPDQIRGRHPLDISQYTWNKTMLEGQILTWGGDRVDMAHSMESRPAFLDHHLAEYAVNIPPSVRIRNGVEKWVLREAMKGVLPEVLYKREKFAFMAPPSHTDKNKQQAVQSLINEWMDHNAIEQLGFFNADKVDKFLSDYKQEKDATKAKRGDIILNHLLGVHMLQRHFCS